MAELEESRRKLVNLKMQKDRIAIVQSPVPFAVNGSISPENTVDKTMGLRDLKDSIEEAKVFILLFYYFTILPLGLQTKYYINFKLMYR